MYYCNYSLPKVIANATFSVAYKIKQIHMVGLLFQVQYNVSEMSKTAFIKFIGHFIFMSHKWK